MNLYLDYTIIERQLETFKSSFIIDMADALTVSVNAIEVLRVEIGNNNSKTTDVIFTLDSLNAEQKITDLINGIIKQPKFFTLKQMLNYNGIIIGNIRQEIIDINNVNNLSQAISLNTDLTDTIDEIKLNENTRDCSSIYNTVYNKVPRDRANKCNGYPIFKTPQEEIQYFESVEPRIQRGRWNMSYTNTKLFPIISRGFEYGSWRDFSKNPEDKKYKYTKPIKQANNLFKNTAYSMSKKELIAYLSRNNVRR